MNKDSQPIRILLVEPDEDEVGKMGQAFQKSTVPIHITVRKSAETALQQILSDTPSYDVLIAEHRLPGISGMELFNELRKRGIHLPFLLIIEPGFEELAIEILKSGAEHFAIKDPKGVFRDLLPILIEKTAERYRNHKGVPSIREELLKSAETAVGALTDNHRLLADMGHEIRTPLNTIVGAADLLLETQLEFKQREYLELIITSCRLLNYILDKLFQLISHPEKSVVREPSSESGPSTKPRILVVEDNYFNQKVVLAILESEGYAVEVAENGKKAVEIFQREPFDLILMDIQMPEMDGLEAAKRIRDYELRRSSPSGANSRIPIIAMTAYAMPGDRDRCLSAGMDEYLTKPIFKEKLLSVIGGMLRGGSGTQPIESASLPALDTAVFNPSTLAEIAGHNPELVEELIRIYFENLPALLDQIEHGIQTGNPKEIRFGAHAVKGMSYNLSAQKVGKAADEIEKIVKADTIIGSEEAYQRLKQEIERLKTSVNIFQRSRNPEKAGK